MFKVSFAYQTSKACFFSKQNLLFDRKKNSAKLECKESVKLYYFFCLFQFHCKDGKYSVIGQLWFQTPEKSVQSLFHMPEGTWSASTLSIFFVVYFIINCWTYGLSVSSGVFIPTLLMGAVFGRLVYRRSVIYCARSFKTKS